MIIFKCLLCGKELTVADFTCQILYNYSEQTETSPDDRIVLGDYPNRYINPIHHCAETGDRGFIIVVGERQ